MESKSKQLSIVLHNYIFFKEKVIKFDDNRITGENRKLIFLLFTQQKKISGCVILLAF